MLQVLEVVQMINTQYCHILCPGWVWFYHQSEKVNGVAGMWGSRAHILLAVKQGALLTPVLLPHCVYSQIIHTFIHKCLLAFLVYAYVSLPGKQQCHKHWYTLFWMFTITLECICSQYAERITKYSMSFNIVSWWKYTRGTILPHSNIKNHHLLQQRPVGTVCN